MKISKMHARVKHGSFNTRYNSPTSTAVDFTALEARIEASLPKAEEEVGHRGKWGWEGPNRADKGLRLGSCNVTACQEDGAIWYNRTMDAWYCPSCAHEINYRPLPDGEYLCVLDDEARTEWKSTRWAAAYHGKPVAS